MVRRKRTGKPKWLRKVERDLLKRYPLGYPNIWSLWHNILDHGYVQDGKLIGEPYHVDMRTLERFIKFCKHYGLTFAISPDGLHGASEGIRTLHIEIWKEEV